MSVNSTRFCAIISSRSRCLVVISCSNRFCTISNIRLYEVRTVLIFDTDAIHRLARNPELRKPWRYLFLFFFFIFTVHSIGWSHFSLRNWFSIWPSKFVSRNNMRHSLSLLDISTWRFLQLRWRIIFFTLVNYWRVSDAQRINLTTLRNCNSVFQNRSKGLILLVGWVVHAHLWVYLTLTTGTSNLLWQWRGCFVHRA